jgi:hypothetical protein
MGLAFLRPVTGPGLVAQRPVCRSKGICVTRSALIILVAGLSCISVLGAGCGSIQSPSTQSSAVPSSTAPSASPTKVKPAADSDFDPKNFSHPLDITNQYFPMVPGTRLHWKGHAFDEDNGERIAREIDFTVSDMTKVIDGVQTRVAWDRDYTDGEVEEVELTYYAQDDFGTVWYFGEYSEEIDNGKIDDSPAWLGGQQKARPGITMQAQPATGTKDYAEGWGPAVEWNDRAKVDQVGISNCVKTGCYDNVVVIAEFNPDEPGKTQLKYYAPGLGGIRTGWRGKNEKEREELELTSHVTLSDAELASVEKALLAQEKRAYSRRPQVFEPTASMQKG